MKRPCAAKPVAFQSATTENMQQTFPSPLLGATHSQHQEEKKENHENRSGGKEKETQNLADPHLRTGPKLPTRKRTERVSVRFFSERTKERPPAVGKTNELNSENKQQKKSLLARAHMTGNEKKEKALSSRCQPKEKRSRKKKMKKKRKQKQKRKRVPEPVVRPPAARVPSLLKGRLRQSTVGASPAAASAFLTTVRRNARSLKHPRAPVVNTLSLDDLALVVSRGLALGKRETRAVHAPAVQRREHQPHVRTHVDSLEVVPRNLLPERHELVLVLPRVADELRPARRRSPTLGQQVVLEFHVQPPAQASRALVDVDVDVTLLHRRVVRAPEPHERTRRDVPWRDVGVVQELGLGDVEEPRTSGRRVDPSRHVVGHQPSPESEQRSAAHRCRAACVRRPEHAPADVRRVLGQGRLQGRRVLGLGSCEERRDQGCDGLHFFFFLLLLCTKGLRAKPVLRKKA